MTEESGAASMTGWRRRTIAAIGLGLLVVVLFAIFAVEAVASLCRLSDGATCASGPPAAVRLLMPLTVVGGYAVTVWRAQLTPLLVSAIAVIPEAVVIGLIWD